MLGTLVYKELKLILLSPKFSVVFLISSILIILSIYTGIKTYLVAVADYETAMAMEEQQRLEAGRWVNLSGTVYRQPDPLQIFVAGVSHDIGTQARLNESGIIDLEISNYSDNTLFAVFRFLDLGFIVHVVISLFAILLTFDAISGEREGGTLKLNLAYAVPRSRYIMAKFFGSWLGLFLPLSIPFALGAMLILLYPVPMTAVHWALFGCFMLLSALYATFFISLGLLLSSLNRHSSTAFLCLLVIWLSLVFIIPRAGVMLAGQLVSVPTAGEVAAQLQRLRAQAFEMERDGATASRLIGDADRSLRETVRNRHLERENLAFLLSRLSPAASYQLAALDLAGTGSDLKNRTEDQMRTYSGLFFAYRDRKMAEADASSSGSTRAARAGTGDLSGMPRFRMSARNAGNALTSAMADIAVIAIYILLTLAGSFFAFSRYDVR